jgi:hypothetical protein
VNTLKTQKSLYIVIVPTRSGQSGGKWLVAGRPEADAYAGRFIDAKVKHLPQMRTSAAMVKTFNPYLTQPVPPRDAPPLPVAIFHKPTPLWVVKAEDGTEQQIFETAEDAEECAKFMGSEYCDPYTGPARYTVEKVA